MFSFAIKNNKEMCEIIKQKQPVLTEDFTCTRANG